MTLRVLSDKLQNSVGNFEGLRLEHVECLSYWFWLRETFTFWWMATTIMAIEWWLGRDNNELGLKEKSIVCLSPLLFVIMPILAFGLKDLTIKTIKDDDNLVVAFNKKSIEYYTIMTTLVGGTVS